MELTTFMALYKPFCTSENDKVYLRLVVEDPYGDDDPYVFPLTSEKGLAIVKYAQALMLGRTPRPAETKEFVDVIKGAALTLPRQEKTYLDQEEEVEEELPPLAQVVEAISLQGGARLENGYFLQRVMSQ